MDEEMSVVNDKKNDLSNDNTCIALEKSNSIKSIISSELDVKNTLKPTTFNVNTQIDTIVKCSNDMIFNNSKYVTLNTDFSKTNEHSEIELMKFE